MIVKPGTFRLKRSLTNRLVGIFANGQDGAWYDFSIPYLYTTSTGVTSVAAAEDPIGLLIDRRLGAGLGAEIIPNGDMSSSTGWTVNAGWAISEGVCTHSAGTANEFQRRDILTEGKAYRVTFTVNSISGGTLTVQVGGPGGTQFAASAGSNSFIGIAAGVAANNALRFIPQAATAAVIDNVSIKLLYGNHAIQATAAARLTYRVDSGLPYAAVLGTDDSVTSATGGGGTVGFCYVAALKPTGGAGTLRTIWSDTGTNTGRKVQIDTNNKLSFSAGNGTAFTTLASTATLDVGTKYVITVRDNGTNLSVQINTAAAETVGRPVVSAGTTGFTQFKDNGAATSFLIADVYHVDYANNSALTDAQVADAQAYARSRIGL